MANNSLKVVLGILIMSSALFCVLPTDISLIRSGANYTVHIMFANLALGLLFLIFNEKRLLFTSFIACAILCLYLKSASNNVLKLPSKTIQASLNIAQLNIASTQGHIYETIEEIKNVNVDILSLQEITPDMGMVLKEELNQLYPHRALVHRQKDFLGLGIFSKLPFINLDTFYVMEKYVSEQSNPVITIGDFNQLQFSNYLKDLKRKTLLNDSRRFQFFDNPTDHILFSSHFDCVEFQTISNRFTNHLGIKGSYQLNNNEVNVQQSANQF